MKPSLIGSKSLYAIKVVINPPLNQEQLLELGNAIAATQDNVVAGYFRFNEENVQTVTFHREAEVDAPLIVENFQGQALEDPRRAAMSQLAAEFEECKPNNLALLSIIDKLKGGYTSYVSIGNGEGVTTYVMKALSVARDRAAEREFERYDFGEVGVQDMGGWEISSGNTERSRPVYITDDEADDENAPTIKITFTVNFEPLSAKVSEAYAMTPSGNFLGKRYVPSAKPAQPKAAPEVTTATALVELLAGVEGAMSVNSGVLWLEDGQSITLEAIKKSQEQLVAKAKAFEGIISQLEAIGFGENDPINGGDCVESVDQIYQSMIKRFPRP